MAIRHIRVDERLVHGQVASAWSNTVEANRIMVINDAANGDEFAKKMLRMATPSQIALSVLTIEKAITRIGAGQYDNDRVLVIFKSISDALEARNQGFKFEKINIGNSSSKDTQTPIAKGIYINSEDQKAIDELKSQGVKVTVQMTPADGTIKL
ncbi:MAG: PTS sugar transporter subunit IIB [Bacilli bacterium]